jgi:creatinine amidohydrolase
MGRVADDGPARFPPYDVYPENPDWVPPSGSLSPGRAATPEMGKLLVEDFVELVTSSLKAEFRSAA